MGGPGCPSETNKEYAAVFVLDDRLENLYGNRDPWHLEVRNNFDDYMYACSNDGCSGGLRMTVDAGKSRWWLDSITEVDSKSRSNGGTDFYLHPAGDAQLYGMKRKITYKRRWCEPLQGGGCDNDGPYCWFDKYAGPTEAAYATDHDPGYYYSFNLELPSQTISALEAPGGNCRLTIERHQQKDNGEDCYSNDQCKAKNSDGNEMCCRHWDGGGTKCWAKNSHYVFSYCLDH